MSNFKTYYHFQLDFQTVDQHTGGKWLIHGPKRRKDNQLQSLEHRSFRGHGVTTMPPNIIVAYIAGLYIILACDGRFTH